MVDCQTLGLEISALNARKLVELGEAIRKAARAQVPFTHPENEGLGAGPNFAMFVEPFQSLDNVLTGKGANIIAPGKVDRSPCGTGSSARLATLHARGQLGINETVRTTYSILDTSFECRIVSETSVGGRKAIVPQITGSAYITGQSTVLLDPDDPFPVGYTLLDTSYAPY